MFLQDIDFHFRFDLITFLLFSFIFLYNTFSFYYDSNYPNSINHFEYRYLPKRILDNTNSSLDLIEKYNYNVMFIGPDAYYFKIILNRDINYLDLINMGNFGYNGSYKLLDKVKDLDKNFVFFVSNYDDSISDLIL